MSDSFDPYRQWLGIEVDSPNYFELLEISPTESDVEQIALAAKKQLNKVRAIRPAERLQAWTALIDEIKEAETCLVDPQYRSAYLAGIKAATNNVVNNNTPLPAAQLAESDDTLPVAVEAVEEVSVEYEVSETIEEPRQEFPHIAHGQTSDPSKIRSAKRRKKKSWKVMIVGHVIISVSLIGLGYYLFVYSKKKPTDSNDNDSNITQNDTQGKSLPDSKLNQGNKKKQNEKSLPDSKLNKDLKKKKNGKGKVTPKKSDKKKTSDKKNDTGKKNQNKIPFTPVDAKNLTPTFRYLVLKQIRNLEFRQFNAAAVTDASIQTTNLSDDEKQVLKRFEVVAREYKNFWKNVIAQADKIPGGAELNVAGRDEPMAIIEADREKIVFRYAGGNRSYYTNFVPNLVAEALLERQLGGKQATDFNLRVNVFRAFHEFKKPGSIKSALVELRKLINQTADAQVVINFFEHDWPKLLEMDVTGIPEQDEIDQVKKSLMTDRKLNKTSPVPEGFIGEATGLKGKDLIAMLELAAECNSKAGQVDCLDALQWLHHCTDRFDPKSVMQLVKNFPKRKNDDKYWDAYFFAQRVLNILERGEYNWESGQKTAVLKQIATLVKNYQFENLIRIVENKSK